MNAAWDIFSQTCLADKYICFIAEALSSSLERYEKQTNVLAKSRVVLVRKLVEKVKLGRKI